VSIFEGLARVLEAAAEECRALAAEERADRREWIDQSNSVMGSRTHIRAARRRLAAGLDGVAHVGRRWLLSPEALAEELQTGTTEATFTEVSAEVDDEVIAMRRELSIVRGGRR
jgi:hypothetical protein